MLSIQTTIHQYLETVLLARSENTFRTYKNGMNAFINMLLANEIDVDKSLVDIITVEHFSSFIQSLKGYAPATEQLYLTSVLGFYEYLVAENLSSINL